jgi:hypothetical protein
VGLGEDERMVGLIHLGYPRQEKAAPERLGTGEYASYLD